ncbi:hypothetical protein ElyMa_001595300 [Elysia marginata]|uniref:Uncharacterized protein n=1 Tax=Elysia marginata TaxID=1093978 RepID=A0AAV4JF79_9GAST|nr:hypothetical protein ElyMa_001595300 [Elysia marginata]
MPRYRQLKQSQEDGSGGQLLDEDSAGDGLLEALSTLANCSQDNQTLEDSLGHPDFQDPSIPCTRPIQLRLANSSALANSTALGQFICAGQFNCARLD